MRPIIVFLLVIISPIIAHATNAPIKWGEIPAEDLALKTYDKDPAAAAIILNDFGTMTFKTDVGDLSYQLYRHKRYKVFNRKGFEYGDVTIYYRKEERIKNLEAQLFSPDGKITKLKDQDIYDVEVTENVRAKRFSMPGMVDGAVFELRYDFESEDIFAPDNWYFQYDIPIRYSELQVENNGGLVYVVCIQGDQLVEKEENKISRRNFGKTSAITQYRYWAHDVPALTKQPFLATINDYRLRAEFQLQRMQIPGYLEEIIKNDWKDVGKIMLKHDDLGKHFTKKSRYKEVWEAAKPLVDGLNDPEEKIKLLYDFVNNNIHENGIYWLYSEDSPNDVYKNGKGTGSQINMTLLALLKESGLNVNPVFISTRSNGQIFKLYPFYRQFNHMLVLVNLGEDMVLLDAGDKDRPPGMISYEARNYSGFLLDDKKPYWINLPIEIAADTYGYEAKIEDDGTISGKILSKHTGYDGFVERKLNRKDKDGNYWRKRIEEKFTEVEIKQFETENLETSFLPIVNKIDFSIQEGAMASGDRIYLDPIPYSIFIKNPFQSKSRSFPVEMPCGKKEQVLATFEVPEGYEVEELPDSFKAKLPNDGGYFQYMSHEKEGKIHIKAYLVINHAVFPSKFYQELKSFFEVVEEKYSEQVVLKKKDKIVISQK